MSQTTPEKPQDAAERREARAQRRRALLQTRLSLVSVGACLLVFALIAIFLLVFPRSTTCLLYTSDAADE